MQGTLESTLPWWIAGPILGLVIVALLGLANKRFGVLGGVTDLVRLVGEPVAWNTVKDCLCKSARRTDAPVECVSHGWYRHL